MNKIITNLAQITQAAEYFDKKTSAAWRIRSCITNMLVWAANSYIRAKKSMDVEQECKAAVRLATLRTWMRDCNESSFVLDLTPSAVRKTLGLERVVDIHEEACREARFKCIQTRSAANFKKFYDAAISAHTERMRQREENVESIAELLSDNTIAVSHEMSDYFKSFMHNDIEPGDVEDQELYDDAAVEQEADTLAECVANALEAMYDVCESQLAAAITIDKVQRLTGYHHGIMQMMQVVGVDTKRIAQRRVALEAQIAAMAQSAKAAVASIDAEIEAQLASMTTPAEPAEPVEATKPKRTRVKAEEANV